MRDEHRISLSFTVLAQVAGWLIGVLLAYGAIQARVAVVENNVSALQTDLREVKTDVKTLLLRGVK